MDQTAGAPPRLEWLGTRYGLQRIPRGDHGRCVASTLSTRRMTSSWPAHVDDVCTGDPHHIFQPPAPCAYLLAAIGPKPSQPSDQAGTGANEGLPRDDLQLIQVLIRRELCWGTVY